jgi:putative DNA primase/helicase
MALLHPPSGARILRHWRGAFHRWDGGVWTETEDRGIRADLYAVLENAYYVEPPKRPAPWSPNRRKIADVLEALAAITHLTEHTDAPAWLNDEIADNARHGLPGAGMAAREMVAVRNGLLHVPTRALIEHTPFYWNRVLVPFDYDPDALDPVFWLKFLDDLWPDDDASRDALAEWFGYIVSGRCDHHKIMLIVGPTRAGKGVIGRILAALVGRANVAGPTLASLGQNFGLQPLIGKPLAIISDARLGGSNVSQVVERLLSISGEDYLTVDRKFRDPWTGRLPSRFTVLTNELPRFGDASGALAHRFVVLSLTESWLGREDLALTDRLLDELPGILLWALDGLARLDVQGHFTEPATSAEAVTALQDLASPVSAFVRDRCLVAAGLEIEVGQLYTAWKDWCEMTGGRPGTVQVFGRDLRAVIPGLRVAQPRIDGQQDRYYRGVALR